MRVIFNTIIVLLSFSAAAETVILIPTCTALPDSNDSECRIINTFKYSVDCHLKVSGVTRQGNPVSFSPKYSEFLYSGMRVWFRIFNPYFNDPITSLSGTANCKVVK